MKGLSFYALIVSIVLVIVLCILFTKACSPTSDEKVLIATRQYDSAVQVIQVGNGVMSSLHERYITDSFNYENEIAILKKSKVASDFKVSSLKGRVHDLTKKYEAAKGDTVLTLKLCDSLAADVVFLGQELENQMAATDEIVSRQETEIDSLRTVVKKQNDFRIEFMKADAIKDAKFGIVANAYDRLNKKHNNWYQKWGKYAVGVVAGAGATYLITK